MNRASSKEHGVVCGITFGNWLSDPLLQASGDSALRVFACRVARLALSQCECPDSQIVSVLDECERCAGGSESAVSLHSKWDLVQEVVNSANERAEELKEAYETGSISVDELGDSWECARAYESVLACMRNDPLSAAANAVYSTRWAFSEEDEEEFRERIEPLLSLLSRLQS